jgi:hypothetical protein
LEELLAQLDTPRLVADHVRSDREFKDAVQRLFDYYAGKAGLLDTWDDLVRDTVDERMIDYIVARPVRVIGRGADEPDDRRSAETSCSVTEIVAAVFTEGPTDQECKEGDAVWTAVGKKVRKVVTDSGQDGYRGRVQKALKAQGLILVRGNVYRDGHAVEGMYATVHPEAMLHEFWGSRANELAKLGNKWEEDMKMNRDRLPAETMASIEAYLQGEVRKLTARLGMSLGTGDANGRPKGDLEAGK